MIGQKKIIIIACILLLPSSALAGAWCMKQGAFYGKVSYNQYYTFETFDKHGNTHRNPLGSNFHDYNITWYAEYGLRDDLTVIATVPYKWLNSHYRFLDENGKRKQTTYTYDGPGDIETGLKYCFLDKPLVLSVQGLVKLAWLYDGDEDVPPGNNQNDYELKLLAGKSLWPFPGYCGVELGYRWRTNDPSDEYRYLLEFGMNFTEKLSGRAKLDGIKSVKNARLPKPPEPYTSAYVDYETGRVVKTTYEQTDAAAFTNPSLGLEYDLAKLELTLGYQCAKRWSFEFTYTGYPYGENIGTGYNLSCAVVYYFSK